MFTGIVEHVGRLEQLRAIDGGVSLRIDLGPLCADLALGDSVAVDGICLTATAIEPPLAHFDASTESLRRTTLGEWRPGRALNLERAMAVGARFGGHIVGGHVDGVGKLERRLRSGNSEEFHFLLPADGSVTVVEKGSIAIDGVSLTTWDCRGLRFKVAVIPHSLARTTLAAARPGTRVNLEQDVVGRWVERLLAGRT